MNDLPTISIVIPCYNDHLYVEEAVNSALKQTYPKKEIIVVDDGSNEQTKAILKKLEPKIELLITQRNKGLSAARNVGIEAGSGEFILVWDADDFFKETFCEKAFEIMKNNPLSCKLVTCWVQRFDEKLVLDIHKPRGGALKNFLYSNAAMACVLFKKEDWAIINGYDENMKNGYEDWEFYLRFLREGGEAIVLDEVLFYYRQKHNSLRKQANNIRYQIWGYIFKKHRNLYMDHFDSYTLFLLNHLSSLDDKIKKERNGKEYQLGKKILIPLRWIKGLFNK